MPGERTEQATPHRREKARREGDLLVSRELTGSAAFFAGVLALRPSAVAVYRAWRSSYPQFLEAGRAAAWEPGEITRTLATLQKLSLGILWPSLLTAALAAVTALAVAMLQAGGLNLHPQAAAFKIERLNPLTNLKNLVSLRAAIRARKSLIPAALVGVIAAHEVAAQFRIPAFSTERLTRLAPQIYSMFLAASLILLGWSAVDYLIEWQSREQRLRMSREEMREEFKETEGNPQTRGRIRSIRRAMRQQKLRADVAKAAVVVTNPTHYAVALSFDFATMEAPRVLAKGRNLIAEEIKQEARWAGVPILENPPLARSLYRSVEAGQPIPADLYATVAAILTYLYRDRVQAEMRARQEAERARSAGQRRSEASASGNAGRPGNAPSASTDPRAGRGQTGEKA
jgi:flagellar biosynthetic protein FlhB